MTTIASEIQRIKTNIANTYTVLEEKGATLPETLNSANLATCAESVPSGGGGNPLSTAKATKFSQNGMGGTVNIQIDSNGVASGFDYNDFLQFPFLVQNSSWDLNFCLSVTSFSGVLCSNNFGTTIGQNFCLWLDNGKVNLGIDNNGIWHDELSTSTFSTNEYFYVRLSYNGSDTFSFYTSSDGIIYNKEFDYTCTLNCNGILNIGNDFGSSYQYLRGSIDLTHSNLKINNETYNFI